VPILALDMYEHAYHLDFGTRAAAYVDAVMRNLAWERIAARFDRAVAGRPAPAEEDDLAVSAEQLKAMLDRRDAVAVLDLRQSDDLAKAADRVVGATWRDPTCVAEWAAALPTDRPVVGYCVYGFQVSRDAVAALRRRGVDARHLAGGIAAWHAIGAPTEPLA
jgi:Fe-Mn family superoxide dismutase